MANDTSKTNVYWNNLIEFEILELKFSVTDGIINENTNVNCGLYRIMDNFSVFDICLLKKIHCYDQNKMHLKLYQNKRSLT